MAIWIELWIRNETEQNLLSGLIIITMNGGQVYAIIAIGLLVLIMDVISNPGNRKCYCSKCGQLCDFEDVN